ncbi:unnamed protein product [Rotaria sordida]|uniref:Uncharacterized protein n=1 Tax=Rotaria sordida TaxID=392033 RepID=A0A819DUU6_9BILA|nr:unnamed protein product [Rotaria sordida]
MMAISDRLSLLKSPEARANKCESKRIPSLVRDSNNLFPLPSNISRCIPSSSATAISTTLSPLKSPIVIEVG